MGSEWPFVRLGDVCRKIGSGATPRGGSSVYLSQGKIALIRSQNVYNDGFKKSGLVFISDKDAKILNNVVVEPDDVLLNITGDSVARCCHVDTQILPARVNQHVAIIRPRPNMLDSKFLRYFLISPGQQSYMLSLAYAGATRKALTKGMIESFLVPLPPFPEQRAIARILGTLDDKIELNRRMNETLEAMAQALFKSWFVDFDPVLVNALKAGNPIPEKFAERAARYRDNPDALGLPEDILRLYPARFVDSELGPIPEGWEVCSVYRAASVIYGAAFKSKFFNTIRKGLPLIRIRDLKTHFPQIWTTEQHPKGTQIHAGDILVGMDGEFRAVLWQGSVGWLNQRVCMFEPLKDVSRAFVYLAIQEHLAFYEKSKTGTTVIHLGKNDIDKFKIVFPGRRVMKHCELSVDCLINQIVDKAMQSKTLATLRDTLLPKLISGELRVPDVERILEQVK